MTLWAASRTPGSTAGATVRPTGYQPISRLNSLFAALHQSSRQARIQLRPVRLPSLRWSRAVRASLDQARANPLRRLIQTSPNWREHAVLAGQLAQQLSSKFNISTIKSTSKPNWPPSRAFARAPARRLRPVRRARPPARARACAVDRVRCRRSRHQHELDSLASGVERGRGGRARGQAAQGADGRGAVDPVGRARRGNLHQRAGILGLPAVEAPAKP